MTRRRLPVALAGLLAAAAAALLLVGERRAAPSGRYLRDAGLDERFEEIGGQRVRFVRKGSGPTLLLLHGLGSSLFTWSAVLGDLAREHDVIALDFPGFGGSARPPDLAFEHLEAAALGLLDRLGVERASLAGNSLGGAVAVALAARHPTRVERLVLIDAAGFNFAERDRPGLLRLVGALPPAVLEGLPVRRALTTLALRQVFFEPAKVDAERIEEYLAPLQRPGTLRSLRSLLASRSLAGGDFPELLRRVAARTLILWGREDRWIPVADADRFAAAIPGSRTVVLRGCGHLPQEERPEETAALMISFLAPGRS